MSKSYDVRTKFTLTFTIPYIGPAASAEQAAEIALDAVVRLVELAAEAVGGTAENLVPGEQWVEVAG